MKAIFQPVFKPVFGKSAFETPSTAMPPLTDLEYWLQSQNATQTGMKSKVGALADTLWKKSFCAQSAVGTGGNFVVTHANTGGRLDFGTGSFEIGVTARQDTVSAGSINIIAKQNGGPSYGGITFQRSGKTLYMFFGDDAGSNFVTYTNNNYFLNTTDWRSIRVVRTGARTLQIFSSLNGAAETDDTAGFTKADTGSGDINISSVGNLTFCPKGTSFNNLYFKNAAGVKVLDLALSGSTVDRSGNNTVVGTTGTVTTQGLTDLTHTNMLNGCDVYADDADVANRTLWQYVPYKNGSAVITEAQLEALLTPRTFTLVRNAPAPTVKQISTGAETWFEFPDTAEHIMDKSNALIWNAINVGAGIFYDATSAATKRQFAYDQLNQIFLDANVTAAYADKIFVGLHAGSLDGNYTKTGVVHDLLIYTTPQSVANKAKITKFEGV